MKIYLIDDEKHVLDFLEEQLSEALSCLSLNADVKCFTLPSKLLEETKIDPPDIVFMDIQMPGITGLLLAQKLMEIKNNINIIFVTGFEEYAMDALNLYASGYILKPADSEDIVRNLKHLRFPVEEKKSIVRIMTFGNFCITIDNKPVIFRSQKSKELLAYLVDRQGSAVTRKEVAAVLFEDDDYSRYVQKSLCRAANYLSEDLEKAGITGLFINGEGNYALNLTDVECDLMEYLNNDVKIHFTGEYMEQYSWGEYRKYQFE